jgi:hypothetical protein
MNEADEQNVKLFKAREDTSKAFEPAEQALDLVAALVHRAVVFPGLEAVRLGRNDRDESEVQRELTGLCALVGPIHQQMHRPRGLAQSAQQLAPLGRVVRLPRRQGERYGRSSIRGNHMNLGGPSAARSPDGLWTVFLAHRSRRDEP